VVVGEDSGKGGRWICGRVVLGRRVLVSGRDRERCKNRGCGSPSILSKISCDYYPFYTIVSMLSLSWIEQALIES
jgi:hypothetical protein